MLNAIKNNVIPANIKVSFQIKASPTPFSIIPFKIIINHFAGIILLIICKGNGILAMGKMKPDNKITGSIKPINEIIIAVCWVEDTVEIKMPNDNALMIKSTLSNPSKNKLPSTGILNIKMLNKTMTTALITDKNM